MLWHVLPTLSSLHVLLLCLLCLACMPAFSLPMSALWCNNSSCIHDGAYVHVLIHMCCIWGQREGAAHTCTAEGKALPHRIAGTMAALAQLDCDDVKNHQSPWSHGYLHRSVTHTSDGEPPPSPQPCSCCRLHWQHLITLQSVTLTCMKALQCCAMIVRQQGTATNGY